MSPVDRIHRLVETGRVSPAEGERLLATLGARPTRRAVPWVLDPFDRVGGGIAAAVGAVAAVVCVAFAPHGTQFDGFLDCHTNPGHAVPLTRAALEQAVDWVVPALLFWGYARAMSRHVRLLDFVGFIGLARALQVLQGLATIALVRPELFATLPRMTPALMALVAIAIPLFGWQMTLLYFGFKNASGLAGSKLVAGFIALVVLSEVMTKAILAVSH